MLTAWDAAANNARYRDARFQEFCLLWGLDGDAREFTHFLHFDSDFLSLSNQHFAFSV